MRNVALSALLSAGLVLAALAWWNSTAPAQAAGARVDAGATGDLIALSTSFDERTGQLTIIDPRMRVVSVYHVERETGEIALKSVRNVNFDLQMIEFNSAGPSPREIRALLDQK